MNDALELNVPLLKRRVPNLTAAARSAGLRAATVSDLTTGKISVGRAEVRTLAALAEIAGCSLDELVLRGSGASLVETGIKVIDLFAPLPRGGTAGMLTLFAGVGQMVALGELLRSLATRRGFSPLVWLPDEGGEALEEAIAAASGSFRDMVEPFGRFVPSLAELLEAVAALRATTDVMVVADRGRVLSGELLQLKDELAEAGSRPVTYVLYDLQGHAEEAEGAPFGSLDVVWRFDADLAVREVYPAIDPVYSVSSLVEGEQLEAAHLSLASRARRELRRYRELRQGVAQRGLDRYPPDVRVAFERGERLEAFMTQPFFVAEPYTKRPGAAVPLQETLAGARRILDGEADGAPVDSLRWLGQLPDQL